MKKKSFTLSKRRASNGFGLLEVIFATAILMMFLVAGIVLVRGSVRNAATGNSRVAAISFANQQIEQLRGLRDAGYINGSFDLYKGFDDYMRDNFGALPVCYKGDGTELATCDYDELKNCQWCSGGGYKLFKIFYTKDFFQFDECKGETECSDPNLFYTVQIKITPSKFNQLVDVIETTISWTEYGVTKTIKEETWLLGCPGVSYEVGEAGPVDVVVALDHSGSMRDSWGSPPVRKITSARLVATSFNNKVITFNAAHASDGIRGRVALVDFPVEVKGKSGFPDKWFANRNGWLTAVASEINALNTLINSAAFNPYGRTPIADAIIKAGEVFGNQPESTAYRALILTSDGVANVSEDGIYRSSGSLPADQAIQRAGELRARYSNLVHIFVVAIGNDFALDTLVRIADSTEPPYFQVASDPATLDTIFNTIFTTITESKTKEVCPGQVLD